MSILELPDGYRLIHSIDMQKDKKLAWGVNGAAILLMVAVAVVGGYLAPEGVFAAELWAQSMVPVLIALVGFLLYIVAHELVHGLMMKRFSKHKILYGITPLYAYVGSESYFKKKQHMAIGLAPAIFFGVIFLLLNIFLPPQWYLVVLFLQMMNIGGSAGDFYVAWLALRLPDDLLVRDLGVSMTMYSKEAE